MENASVNNRILALFSRFFAATQLLLVMCCGNAG